MEIKISGFGEAERTLKDSEKRGLKGEKKRRCERCKKRFPEHVLVIHHKKPIHTYRDGTKLSLVLQRTKRPSYDWKRNLMVVCKNCHADIHHELSKKAKEKKKRGKDEPFGLDVEDDKLPTPFGLKI